MLPMLQKTPLVKLNLFSYAHYNRNPQVGKKLPLTVNKKMMC